MIGMACGILALAGFSVARAQSAYSNAVMSLNPVAYWPLNETTVPSGVYMATNLGSAQASGNGYYESWWTTNSSSGFALEGTNNIVHSTGGIAGDPTDTALQCGGTGQYLVLPRATGGVTNSAVTLAPPFSVEMWIYIHSVDKLREIMTEGGNNVQLGPDFGNALGQEGIEFGINTTHFYWKTYDGPGVAANSLTSATGGVASNTWYHVVLTFDGTHKNLYVNGAVKSATLSAKNAIGALYMPDFVSPMIFGNGNELGSGNSAVFDGSVDEMAVYNYVLDSTAVNNHYNTGINPAPATSYVQTVLADTPTIYLRLDEPLFTAPNLASLPVAANLGSLGASANGLYQPGTVPGAPGPTFTGFGSLSNAVALNFMNAGVDVGGGALPAQLNPTGTQPLTVMTWFRGNPADAGPRIQDLISHGTNSYRIGLDLTPGNNFNPGAGPQLAFTNATDLLNAGMDLNDGQWHMAAGVSDGTNEFLYLDGLLVKSNASVASIPGNPQDLILGGDPYFLGPIPGAGTGLKGGVFYDGSIAHVAFFTNALSASQIQQVFSAANVPPVIHVQPSPTDLTLTVGTNVFLPTVVSGSSPINYQWYTTNNTPVSGQTGSSLIIPSTTVGDSSGYYLVAANNFGSATSAIVNVTVFGPPIVTQSTPSDVRVFTGTAPKLNITIVGTPPFAYQWMANGTNIDGATNASFTVDTTQLGATTYIGAITNSSGVAFVTNIVTVLADPTAPYPAAVLTDHPIAYYRLDEGGGTTAYDYAGGNNATYTNVNQWVPGYNSTSDPNETAAEFGDVPPNNDYAGNVPSYVNFETNSGNVEFSVEAWATQYFISGAGNGIVTLGSGGADQFLIDAGGTGSALRFVVRNAAGTSFAANSGTVIANDGLWHHLVGVCDEAGGHLFFYMDGVQIATTAITPGSGIMASTVPLSIGARESSNNPPNNYDYQLLGAIDDVAIYNQALSSTQVRNHYFSAGAAPLITKLQPVNASANENGSVTFTVTASGSPPVTYQWFDNNGTPIALATNATLTLTGVQSAQAGNYSVTVTDSFGSSSTNTSLVVNSGAPVLAADIQPTNIACYAGAPNTLFVTVDGTEPLAYQWLLNGAIIPDATNASYNFAALAGTNEYSVTVSNSFGGLESGTATVGAITPVLFRANDYTSSLRITFNGYSKAGTLTNFPVLVRLSTNIPGFSYGQFASSSGADLTFGSGTNTQALADEIEQWNPAGESLVWVQVPLISSNTDFITAYWGNPAQTEPAASNTNGAVWKGPFSAVPEFDLVWHLNQSTFPFTDSALQFPSTNGGPGTAGTGIVGAGLAFDGTGTFLNAGNINLSNSFTLSSWINISPSIGNIMTIWASKPGSGTADGFAMNVNNFNTTDGALRFITGNGTSTGPVTSPAGSVTFGQWHLVTATVDTTANTARVFVDGTDVTTGKTNILADFSKTNNIILGVASDGFFSFEGTMDEARVENGTRSPNWIWASWATVSTNANFATYSAVNSSAIVSPTLGFSVSGGNVQLNWTTGTLQSANEAQGPYSDIVGATSPYPVPLDKSRQFYRLRVP
jgi:hypothetical protein